MKICDKESLKKVLSNAIPLLCQSGLPKQTTFRIDAMIGITIDSNEGSTLICFSEKIGPNNQPNIMSLVHNVDSFSNANDSNVEYNNIECNNNNNIEYDNNNIEPNNNNIEYENDNIEATTNNIHEYDDSAFLKEEDQADDNNPVTDASMQQQNEEDDTAFHNDYNNNNEDANSDNIDHHNIEHTSLINNDMMPNNNIDMLPSNNNNIDMLPSNNNSIDMKHRKRPWKSKPYSNSQMSGYHGNEDGFGQQQQQDNNIMIKQEVDEEFLQSAYEDNKNNNGDENNTMHNNNNEQIGNNNEQLGNNADVSWDNNSQQEGRKWKWNGRIRRPNKKYTDQHQFADSLPLEAINYLDQHHSSTTATIPTSDMLSSMKGNDADYNNLMQGICDFVMSQSQRIDDKSRPQSRTCHICQATLSNPLSLKNHIQGTHLALKLRRCNLCGETFKWTMQLARHKKKVHGGGEFVNIYNVT